MKRIITRSCLLVLSTALLFPMAPSLANAYSTSSSQKAVMVASAPSNAKFTKEQAIAQAKKLFSIPDDYKIENTSFRAADVWRPFPEWSFNWVKKSANHEAQSSIYISIHADTGELTNYSSYSPNQSKPVAKTITRDAAQKIALNFISKMASTRADEVQLYTKDVPTPKTPLGTNVVHYFRYSRVVNNIPFPDNGIDIAVDGSGKLQNYSLNWNDKIKFEQQKPISSDEALEAFKKYADVKLSYFLPWEKDRSSDTSTPILAYPNPFNTIFLDAETGNPLTIGLNEYKPNEKPVPVSDQPLSPLYTGEPLDQDSASSYASKLFDLSDYDVQSANYNENDYRGNRPVWDLQFERKDKAPEKRFVYVSLDAKNGDILSYNMDMGYPTPATKEKPAITEEQGKEKAIQFIRQYSPSLASSMYLVPNVDDYKYQAEQGRMVFNFRRMIDGIPAATGDANVTLDMKTGKVLYYYLNSGKENYPTKLPDHKSEADALKAYLQESEATLTYVLPQLNEQTLKTGVIPERTAKLVYRMTLTPNEQPYIYDAVTGDWKNQASGKPIVLHRPEPSDLKDHPAATELGLLYEYDAISLIDGKIMPNRPITRGEMIDMLVIALNQGRYYPEWLTSRKASFADVASGSRYFASVEAAVNMGILDKSSGALKPDEQITREELADLLVRALGYKKLASHTSLFSTTLTDVANSKVRGSIAIVNALGIMNGSNGQFKPKASVSRADAAVSFYRFLEKRRELVENKNVEERY